MAVTKTKPNRVRIAEVYAPEGTFEGPRERHRFIEGKCSLPEPITADFPVSADFEREHEAWAALLWRYEQEYGYDVRYRYITVEDDDNDHNE